MIDPNKGRTRHSLRSQHSLRYDADSMANQIRKSRTFHLACADSAARLVIESILKSLDHTVLLSTDSGSEMIQETIAAPPELVIASPRLRDMNGIEALIEIGKHRPLPSIVIAKSDDLDQVEKAMDDHVMAYLVLPITREDLQPAIYLAERRFEHIQGLREKVSTLEDRLAERKLIEEAKGIIMRKRNISESEAHRLLQMSSRDSRRRIVDVARTIIDANKILGD